MIRKQDLLYFLACNLAYRRTPVASQPPIGATLKRLVTGRLSKWIQLFLY